MRELSSGWTHFFAGERDPSVIAYRNAKLEEPYAGFGFNSIASSSASSLEFRVTGQPPSPPRQPLLFDSKTIRGELRETGESATWRAIFEAFKRGETVAPPYYESLVGDPEKLLVRSDAYRRLLSGELDKRQLPDMSDVFPDDPQTRAEIGLSVEPNASGPELLIQACEACHNAGLDQTISRARFDVDLTRMAPSALSLAIERLSLAEDDPRTMPPSEARALDGSARARLIAYLREYATGATTSK